MTYAELLHKLEADCLQLKFKQESNFWWSSAKNTIYYEQCPAKTTLKNQLKFKNKLLHEVAHARLNHQDYRSDAELLKIEAEAWYLSKELCAKYQVKFSEHEQNDSLQTYINWASSRVICPKCGKTGLQNISTSFYCLNCLATWEVGKSRFKRTYRKSKSL